MAGFTTVATLAQIPEGRGLTVRAGGRLLALFKTGGEVYALDGECPHRGSPLGEGCVENGTVYCPMHGWQFDLKTGECLDHPEKPARRHVCRVVGGEVQVEIS